MASIPKAKIIQLRTPGRRLADRVGSLELKFAEMIGEWKTLKYLLKGLWVPVLADLVVNIFKVVH